MAPIEPKQKSLEAIPDPSSTSGKNEQPTKVDQKLERLSRVAHTSILALKVWEDTDAAITWLSRPNQSLNGQIPWDFAKLNQVRSKCRACYML